MGCVYYQRRSNAIVFVGTQGYGITALGIALQDEGENYEKAG